MPSSWREGHHYQPIGRHRAHQALDVDIERRLLVEPHQVLLGTLERPAPLLVRLEAQRRDAAAGVPDRHRVGEIENAPRHEASPSSLARHEPRAGEALPRPEPSTRPNSLACTMSRVVSLVLPAAQAPTERSK